VSIIIRNSRPASSKFFFTQLVEWLVRERELQATHRQQGEQRRQR